MINWKLRLQNKTTLLSLIGVLITFIYQVLGILGVVPAISEESVINLLSIMINILVTVGVVIDPTTKGIGDSQQALEYEQPNE